LYPHGNIPFDVLYYFNSIIENIKYIFSFKKSENEGWGKKIIEKGESILSELFW